MSVLFLIPSVGRPTLWDTLQSLICQTCVSWRALVILDGITEAQFHELQQERWISDERIEYRCIPKRGKGINQAGAVRNVGLDIIQAKKKDAEWVAFVDDDDTLSPLYVAELGEQDDVDVVLFRMNREDGIFPPPDCQTIEMCKVGISFVIRRQLVEEGVRFCSSGVEDYYMLQLLYERYCRILFSSKVYYYVRNCIPEREEIGTSNVLQRERKKEDFLFHLLSLYCIEKYYSGGLK
jgi:hypothetical protein